MLAIFRASKAPLFAARPLVVPKFGFYSLNASKRLPLSCLGFSRATLQTPSKSQVGSTSMVAARFYSQKLYPAGAATSPGIGAVPGMPKLQRPRLLATKAVGYWLLFSAAAVFGIVVLGGLTRLTESGLSITEWKPITGSLPPISQEDWEAEFDKYKASPEFQQLNANITLDEYKFIYYMEWGHRLWGRAIGLLIVLPGLYFVLRGKTSPQTNRRLLGISLLLGLQGFIGWWMVKSGLDQDHLDARDNSQPRVSQYRLAAHLGAAFLLYFAMTSTGLGILREHRMLKNPIEAVKDITLLRSSAVASFRRFAIGLTVLAFITSMSGAFVAGLDAGMLYNTWPLMGGRLAPSKNELFDEELVKRQGLKPEPWTVFWKNMLENPVTVQFNHRNLALTTWTLTAALFLYARRLRPVLPRKVYMGAHGAIGFATLQAALGITTLIYVVPVPLAAMHQAGSLAFLTSLLILLNRLKVPRHHIRQLLGFMAEAAGKSGASASATAAAAASAGATATAARAASVASANAAKSL